MVGSWFGAGVVANWPRRNIQIGMGLALLAAAAFFTLKNIDAMRATPVFPGGTALELNGGLLIAGIAGMLFLGALMTLGIGLYAPCMVLVALLGMNPKAAFPIMMGACAFLMPVASARFVKERKYNIRAALGLLIGGVPGVLFAYYIVKEMDIKIMLWLVVVVVTYTGFTMLRAAQRERLAGAGGAGAAKP
jgi:uncharacterized membrane protein YfcA